MNRLEQFVFTFEGPNYSCGSDSCCGDGPTASLRCRLCEKDTQVIHDGQTLLELGQLVEGHECAPDAKMLVAARGLAIKAHKDQTYDGTDYFTGHLEKVASEMKLLIGREDALKPFAKTLIAAAYLHDILEDTPTTLTELAAAVGSDVAELVFAVTDEPGPNRKARKLLTYPKIKAFGIKGVALKLADRLANVKASLFSRKNFLAMYKDEQPEFEAALRTKGELDASWHELNWRLPKPKDDGYYIVVTGDYKTYSEWRALKNLNHPNQAIQLDSTDMFKVFGLSIDHWKVVVFEDSNPVIVSKLLAKGYKVAS